MFKIISKKLFVNLYYFNIVITPQKKQFRYNGIFYPLLIIRVLNRERTARLIMFLSW